MNENYEGLQFEEIKQQIASYCSFSVGKQIVLESYPSFKKLTVELQLSRLRQALEMTIKYGSMPFGGISDISKAVSLAKMNGTLNCEELLKIADHCFAIQNIFDYMKSCECEKNEIKEITDSLFVDNVTSRHITDCIGRNNEVNDNASTELKRIRRTIKQTQSSISSKMASYVSSHRSYLQDDIIAQRNNRSVVLVKNNFKNTINGFQYGQSSSGNATYIEPAELIPLNNELQVLQDEEKREVQRILYMLSQEVKGNGDKYLANNESLGLLDSIFAKARWAKENDAIVGEISDNMDLIIEEGRHPLIDPNKVVANSYHIISPVKTILITGPNTGGKTVSLKLIGLFTIMHLSGMALPCKKASIPIYDNVFYDIGDNQSISDDLSTFSAHAKKLGSIIQQATSKSLVILDELGSGTDPVEGQALASAVLDYFREQQIYTVATTHYAKLKAYGQQYDDILLASVEFDQQNLKPTYRYLENTIGQSNALEIAGRYGVKEEIIAKAREFKEAQQQPEDKVLERLQAQLELVNQQQEYLEASILSLQEEKEQLEKDKQKLKRDQVDIIENAKLEAYQLVEKTKEEAEEIIDELKAQKQYDINEVAQLKHKLNEIVDEVDYEEIVDDTPLALGDYVKIALTNQTGEIISLDKKNATVLCGKTKIKVSMGNLTKITRPKEKTVASGKAKVVSSNNFKIECNLIGMRVEEALPVLDKFLDEALLANAPYVRVIHGFGTGALRKAVWDRLKKYKFVKKYEYAPANQGGSGATIVTLRETSDAEK